MSLATDGALLTTSGDLQPVTVTDTRAGNPGWNLTGQVEDFAGAAGSINGANLGWRPSVLDQSPLQAVTAGGLIVPAAGAPPGADPTDPTLGLKIARTLAFAPPNAGNGTAHLTAALTLQAPTTTPAGTYSATLTLTAI